MQACAPQMAAELSAALSWALDHAKQYGGDPNQAWDGPLNCPPSLTCACTCACWLVYR